MYSCVANYHGSIGCGQDFVNSLLGNVGFLDVADVQVTIATTLNHAHLINIMCSVHVHFL